MTGADMGIEPMVSPARRKIAKALSRPLITQPAQAMQQAAMPAPGMPTMASDGRTDQGADDLFYGGERTSDPRSSGSDQRSYGSFSEMMNDPGFRGDWGKVAGMAGPTAMLGSLAMNALGFGDTIQNGFGGAPGGGLGKGGMADDLAAFGQTDPMAAQIAAAEAPGQIADPMGGIAGPGSIAEGTSPGMFSGGGMVMPGDLSGPDPAGPDQGYAALKAGEVVLNKEQQKKVGREKIARALMGSR